MMKIYNGIKIVDLTTIVMGPMASQILADQGAEVIKIESLEGDLARSSGVCVEPGFASLFVNNNRNKKSVVLNLKTAGGKEVLRKLIGQADVFLHNMRPAALEKLGFGPEQVRAIKPNVIFCAAVGFGSKGSYAGRPAFDDVIQSACGIAALPMELDRDPDYVPSIVADKISALYAANAISSALFRKQRTGEGCEIEVPMFEVMVSFLFNEHLAEASFREDGKPGYTRLLNPNRHPYRTKDGWIMVMPYSGAQWSRVLVELGHDEITKENWFASAYERNQRSKLLYGMLANSLFTRTTSEWIATFEQLDVPYSVVNSLNDLLNDCHLTDVGFFSPTDSLKGRVRSVPYPITIPDVEQTRDAAPPGLGSDTVAVLAGLGFGGEKIRELELAGAIGTKH